MDHGRLPLDRRSRQMFAYVPQGNLLLSGTVRENLTIVRPDATEAEIRNAVHTGAMEEFLDQLPKWEGDKIFLDLLWQDAPFFLLKLRYDGDKLVEAVLDGKKIR